jgi:hypothetical protein
VPEVLIACERIKKLQFRGWFAWSVAANSMAYAAYASDNARRAS